MLTFEKQIDDLKKATVRLKEKYKKDTKLANSLVVATCAVWAVGVIVSYGISVYKDGGNA
jgi:hypothetical protein